jgi:hypothetical protein
MAKNSMDITIQKIAPANNGGSFNIAKTDVVASLAISM